METRARHDRGGLHGLDVQLAAAAVANAANAPQTAKAFLPFTKLDLRADGDFLYVGSNGLPDHNMMVGITAWQQQVPLPQPYFDDNAWRIPLKPVPAKEPAMIKGRFLRGAIALAVNGIPIFNPQNNRGEISYEIGELDQWGGHCGRADDYHYHITPLHLQAQVGKGMPVAYALDGYPIYGLTEPDGSPVANLDECHGHESPEAAIITMRRTSIRMSSAASMARSWRRVSRSIRNHVRIRASRRSPRCVARRSPLSRAPARTATSSATR
jgi:hypothetical protein